MIGPRRAGGGAGVGSRSGSLFRAVGAAASSRTGTVLRTTGVTSGSRTCPLLRLIGAATGSDAGSLLRQAGAKAGSGAASLLRRTAAAAGSGARSCLRQAGTAAASGAGSCLRQAGTAGGSGACSLLRAAELPAVSPSCSRQMSKARPILPLRRRFGWRVRGWEGGCNSSPAGRRACGACGASPSSSSNACRSRCNSRINAAPCGPTASSWDSPTQRGARRPSCVMPSPLLMAQRSPRSARGALSSGPAAPPVAALQPAVSPPQALL